VVVLAVAVVAVAGVLGPAQVAEGVALSGLAGVHASQCGAPRALFTSARRFRDNEPIGTRTARRGGVIVARYNIRDLIGHWVKPRSAQGKMCPYACCRGYRVHPGNYPVILPNPLLRKASEDDLAYHYAHTGSDQAQAQILHEMDRRDKADIAREARKQEHQRRMFARRLAHAEEVDRAWLEAEAATKGNMLNKAGKAADIDERSLFTGPESRARRYASEELLNHWQAHHRPTAAFMQGKDTRVHERYTAPRRHRRPVSYRPVTVGKGKDKRTVEVAVVRRNAS
jgi:hypothetical protein